MKSLLAVTCTFATGVLRLTRSSILAAFQRAPSKSSLNGDCLALLMPLGLDDEAGVTAMAAKASRTCIDTVHLYRLTVRSSTDACVQERGVNAPEFGVVFGSNIVVSAVVLMLISAMR